MTETDAGSTSTTQTENGKVKDDPVSPEHHPSRPLPSRRAGTEPQLGILRAFAAASGKDRRAVQNGDVALIGNVNTSTVSSCNKFFADIKLIEPQGRGYVPAPEVFEFHRQYEWNAETAPHALAPLFRESWIWNAL